MLVVVPASRCREALLLVATRPSVDIHQAYVTGVRRNATRNVRDAHMGSVIKKRRKRMSKKKHRKLLKKTRVQRRKLGK